MVFLSVLQNQFPALPIAQALSAHLSNIIALARAYSWASVLDYHVAFLQARAIDPFFNPLHWIRSDPHLHTLHLLTPSITAPRPPAPSPPVDRLAAKPATNNIQICFAYNGAGCAGPAVSCFRRHVCCLCSGPHPAPMCRAVLDAAPPNA